MASLPGWYNQQFFKDNGDPAANWRVYTYAHGTTTQKNAYIDHSGGTPQTYTSDGLGGQYIALNARGELPAPLFLTGGAYDIVLKDDTGATEWTRYAIGTNDNADDLETRLADDTVSTGAAMIGFKADLNYPAGTLGQAVQDRSYSITDQPWNCVTNTDCSAAIQAANDYVASLGGGVLIFPAGTWIVTANITRSANVTWRGVSSLASKISITNGTASVYHTGARGGIEDLYIEGPYTTTVARAAAASTSIGVIDNGATTWMRNVRIKNFKIGIEQRIGYWKEYYKLWCEENGTGMNFNASGSDFSNLLTFFGCTWRANDRNGIGASATPVNNNVISFYGCDIESNCSESPTTYQQIALGNARGVTWSGGYMEAGSVSPAPDMWNFTNTSKAVIQPMYISGARKAFYASSNAAGDIEITVPYYANGASTITSHAYDFPSCTGITVYDSTVHTATIVLDGTNSQLINKKIAQEEVQSWTPVMSGSSTPGTPTYASQIGRAVRIGNFLHFSVRVTTTGIGGAVGNVRISLPVAHQTISGLISTCAVELTGITPTAGKTYFTGRITSGTNYIEIMEGGNAAGMTQVLWTGVAAASTFIVSGVYPISV